MTLILRPLPVDNVAATTDPVAGSDTTLGYSAGSLWFNTTTGRLFECIVATAAAAVWTIKGANKHPGYVAGRFYKMIGSQGNAYVSTNAPPTLDTVIFLYPFWVDHVVTPASLNIWVQTGAVNAAAKFGIWGQDATTKRPTSTPLTGLSSNTPTALTASTALGAMASPTGTLYPGITYWWGGAYSTGSPQCYAATATASGLDDVLGRTTVASSTVNAIKANFTYANDITALSLTGATFTDIVGVSGVPILWLGA